MTSEGIEYEFNWLLEKMKDTQEKEKLDRFGVPDAQTDTVVLALLIRALREQDLLK